MLKLSFISDDISNEIIINDQRIIKSLSIKSEEEIVEILNLSVYFSDNIHSFNKDERVSKTVKEALKDY